MVEHQKLQSSVASNNKHAIIVPQTFKHHNAITIASPAIFNVVSAA